MFLKSQPKSVRIAVTFFAVGAAVLLFGYALRSIELKDFFGKDKPAEAPKEAAPAPSARPDHIRGIHLTAWVAGSKKLRAKIDELFEQTEVNAVVIAIKEYEGEVYIRGVAAAEKNNAYTNAIPDLAEYVAQLKNRGVYTIARIVVFKDKKMAKAKPEWAVKRPDGSVWADRKGNCWLDPYNKNAWEYNISIATQAIALGFQEIQFDYIRFPSDGDVKQARYSAVHNSSSAARALDGFLDLASKRLKPLGAAVSIDIFGLTPSVQHDMGIGQKIIQMTQWVDYVSPMTYPSHYAKGEYGIPDPNRVPYRVVHKTLFDAKSRLGEHITKIRPYLQDFSLGYKYGPKEVRAQIEACEDLGIKDWLLWSPSCRYTRSAFKSKDGKLSPEAEVPKEWKTWPDKDGGKKKKPAVSASTASVREAGAGDPPSPEKSAPGK